MFGDFHQKTEIINGKKAGIFEIRASRNRSFKTKVKEDFLREFIGYNMNVIRMCRSTTAKY